MRRHGAQWRGGFNFTKSKLDLAASPHRLPSTHRHLSPLAQLSAHVHGSMCSARNARVASVSPRTSTGKATNIWSVHFPPPPSSR